MDLTDEEFDKYIASQKWDFRPSLRYRQFLRAVFCDDPEVWQYALVMHAEEHGQIKSIMNIKFHNDTTQH